MLPKILEFAPAIAFFVSYKLTDDLILATAVIVGSCLIAFILNYVLFRKVSRMQLFVTAAVILFWILSGLHKLWLIAAAGFEISEIAFAVGISAVNFAVAVFFIAIRRMTVDPLR